MPTIKFSEAIAKYGGMYLTDDGKIAIFNPTAKNVTWHSPNDTGRAVTVPANSTVETDWALLPALSDFVRYLGLCHAGGVYVSEETLFRLAHRLAP